MSKEQPTIFASTLPALAYHDVNEAWRYLLRQFALQFEVCLPAQVISYDRTTNIAEVFIPIAKVLQQTNENGEHETAVREPFKVPVFRFGGAGMLFSTPLKEGDTGFVVASDRDASKFYETLTTALPPTYTLHQYSFGFFIPSVLEDATFSSDDDDAQVWQTLDGQTKITLRPGKVQIVTTQNVDITAPMTTITGNVVVNGDIISTGTIQGNVDVVAAGISGKGHIHSGVQTGGGNTGGPVS